jgi:hypothetical protein
MMSPDHRPKATQAKASYGLTILSPIVNVSGKNCTNGITAPVMRIVEIINYHLMIVSTLSIVALANVVAKN